MVPHPRVLAAPRQRFGTLLSCHRRQLGALSRATTCNARQHGVRNMKVVCEFRVAGGGKAQRAQTQGQRSFFHPDQQQLEGLSQKKTTQPDADCLNAACC